MIRWTPSEDKSDDPNVARILRLIVRNDYQVTVDADSMTATRADTGEMFMVRGDDPLTMTAELAGQVGIDLLDGDAAARRSRRDVHRVTRWQKATAAEIQK